MSNLLGLEEENKQNIAVEQDSEELVAQVKSGANWFYWIAGLSVVNSLIYIAGANVAFLAGLGITQLADAFVDVAIENGAPSALKIVTVAFSAVAVVVFGLFGYFANKRLAAVFGVGIVLYVLDGLLLLLLGVFASAAFHAFALFFIIRGFLACRSLNKAKAARAVQAFQSPPAPPTSY